ncbi:dockerin type I domain-containing protein [Methylomonas sp. AM2-LC]|uniref:dockerin type I domain-containing protein n=1 Tax=Methylomonas sp. AM2-LC TaxID=3153301 RepID=UPI00326651B9
MMKLKKHSLVATTTRLSLALMLCWAASPVHAAASFGSLSNFDAINDTGDDCHGFEIELDDVTSKQVTYTFSAPYIQYGTPRLIDFDDTATGGKKGVKVRYESQYDSVKKAWLQTTPKAVNPTMQTAGHFCWTGGSGASYPGEGCEHFGIGVLGTPTNTVYRWLIADPVNPGSLAYYSVNGSPVPASIPAPIWNVQPQPVPPVPPPKPLPPVVQPVIQTPPALQNVSSTYDFSDAIWVKVYVTEAPKSAELKHLLTDDPDVPNQPGETEVNWVVMQALTPTGIANGAGATYSVSDLTGNSGGKAMANNSESVTRRYEFYKFKDNPGQTVLDYYDPETHEAVVGDAPNGGLGDYIGAQMAAVNIVDVDSDTVLDITDNCTHKANTNQRDTDGDGFGNICDPDLNNDHVVDLKDFTLLKASFLKTGFNDNANNAAANADLNGDGKVNFSDLAILKAYLLTPGTAVSPGNGAPGPSK